MKQFMKNQKGITLIALVVTIIILIILAAVSINLLLGSNGLINKAQVASEETIISREREQIGLVWNDLYIENITEGKEITDTLFEQRLIAAGNDVSVEYDDDDNYEITFNDTLHVYTVARNGQVTLQEDEVALGPGLYDENDQLKIPWETLIADKWLTVDSNGVLGKGENFNSNSETTEFSSKLVIDDSVVKLGEYSFPLTSSECNKLTSIIIPDSVTSLNSFMGFTSLKNIKIGNGITSIPMLCFGFCSNLETITLSENLTSIGNSSFSYCNNLKSVKIPDSVTIIDDYAFVNCTNLQEVIVSNNIENINAQAFGMCTNLKSLTLSKSLTKLGSGAILGASDLKDIYYLGTCAEWENIDIFDADRNTNVYTYIVHCTDGDLADYLSN